MTPQEYLEKLNELINNALKELEKFSKMCKEDLENNNSEQENKTENVSNDE